MIEFAKDGNATHAVQRLDLSGHVRGKGHKWKDILRIRITDIETDQRAELIEFILIHKIATEREIRRHKVRVARIQERPKHASIQQPYSIDSII